MTNAELIAALLEKDAEDNRRLATPCSDAQTAVTNARAMLTNAQALVDMHCKAEQATQITKAPKASDPIPSVSEYPFADDSCMKRELQANKGNQKAKYEELCKKCKCLFTEAAD